MKRPIVILDANNIAYRANFVMKNMEYKGKPVGVQFGFLNILRFIIGTFKPYKLFIVWDGKKHKVRMDCNVNYKGHRVKDKRIDFDPSVFQKQKRQTIKLCDLLGLKQALNPEGEADDLIYQLVRKYEAKTKRKILIVSNDKDFNQLITNQVRVWNDNKKLQITPKNIVKHYGYKADQCVDYLSLAGDKTDDIPGYPGIGEKTAFKILGNHGSLLNYIHWLNSDESPRILPHDPNKLVEVHRVGQIMIDLKFFHENYSCPLLFINDKPKYKKHKYLNYATKFGFRQFIQPEFLKLFKP